jgi:uncharacterized protein (DUF1697 family)
MTTYLALLRGVNVSGTSLRMAELKKSLSDLGLENVQTYLQSGNVIFKSKTAQAKLAGQIEARIKKDFGLGISVLVLSAKEIDAIVTKNPLWPESGGEGSHFHATFLFDPVTKKTFDALTLPAADGEKAVLAKGAVLLHCPHGYGRTKLNNTYFEKSLGVKATTRNWKSVLALRELCQGQ